jgi:hypothetical protein
MIILNLNLVMESTSLSFTNLTHPAQRAPVRPGPRLLLAEKKALVFGKLYLNPPSSRSLTLSWLPPPKICRSAVIQPSRTVNYGTFPLPQEARTFVGGAYSFGEGRKYVQRIIHLTAVGISESEKVCRVFLILRKHIHSLPTREIGDQSWS